MPARLRDCERQEVEADDVDDRMRASATRSTRQPSVSSAATGSRGALRGTALTLEHVRAHRFVDRREVAVQERLGLVGVAATQAPSRSFSAASCAVGQSRPAPANEHA